MQKQNEITQKIFVSQQPGHVVSDMNGEKVMLSIKNGKYYNLGVIGGEIWELITSPVSIHQIVSELAARYDVSKEQCEEEVFNFIAELSKEDLVKLEG